MSSATDAGYAVGISSEISPELKQEGIAREIVHRIQNMRRQSGFDIADHIDLWVCGPIEISQTVKEHSTYVKEETLAEEINISDIPADAHSETIELEEKSITIAVRKR